MKRSFCTLIGVLLVIILFTSFSFGEEIVIRFDAAGDMISYNPTPTMIKSAANPYPTRILRELADEWEKLHPGVKIEFPTVVRSNDRTWVVTQLAGGNAPEIIYQNMGVYKDEDYPKGWVVSFDQYYEKPNPYVPGNRKWRDLFYVEWMESLRSADGKFYWVAPDMIPIGFIYNVNVFKKVGVKPQNTWGSLMSIFEKLKGAGYVVATMKPGGGFGGGGSWLVHPLESVVWADKIPQMDVLRPNKIVDTEELVRAIKKGIFSVYDPRYREYLRLVKELTTYYPKGWTTGAVDPIQLFVQEKAAVLEGVGAHLVRVKNDPLRKFQIATFYYPDVTKKDSPFGGAKTAGKGTAGYTTTWQVTNSAVKKGIVDLCMDWLMYITTPKNVEKYVNEYGFNLPGVKGAKSHPILAGFLAGMKRKPGEFYWHSLNTQFITPELWTNFQRVTDKFYLNEISLDECLSELDKWYQKAANDALRQNEKVWDISKW